LGVARTLADYKKEADALLQAGEWLGALVHYRRVISWEPADFDARMKVGHILSRLGEKENAKTVYYAVGLHCMKAGMPLRTLVAVRRLAELDPGRTELLEALASGYCLSSERVRRGVAARVPPPELSSRLLPAEPNEELGSAELIRSAAERAANTEAFTEFPALLPEIPLLSDLSDDAFVRVANTMKPRFFKHGDMVVREGEKGESFFLVADGMVRVFRRDSFGAEVDIARFGAGSVFGEMALVSNTPRTASVQVFYEASLLEVNRDSLRAAAEELGSVANGLEQFTRERLLKNLLATSPMFKPFNKKQRLELIRRFSGHDVAPGTVIIREGEQGRGLFLLLSGECDVMKADGADQVLLATLHPGDPFGEISLLRSQPTSATVSAAMASTVLFLPRELFQQLVQAVPDVKTYFESLVEEREMDTQIALETPDEVIEVDDEDKEDQVLI
jgi:CRP-like cAMP-binding protein